MDDREEWLARTFIELGDTLVADFDVIDLMCVLVERCAELLESTEVALALADARGQLRALASTTERMRVLELIEIQSDEGPCRDCFRSGEAVVNQQVALSEERWPRFATQVGAAGFQMVHALPLRLRDDTIGAMNIFDTRLRDLTSQEVNLAQALADAATIAILQERTVRQGAQLARQLQAALNSRIVIEQAKGVVAERLHLGMDEAFALIRTYARNGRLRLSEIAGALVAGTLSASELSSAQQSQSSAQAQSRQT